jgi:hypothetical protein
MTLTCPSPENIAAVAKQLHATALPAEQEIFISEQLMRSAVNRPTVVLTSTSALTGISAATTQDLGLTSWATTFDNTTGAIGSGSGSFGPQNSGGFTTLLGEGLYEVGLCATAVASGVVTDNSYRQFLIQHNRPDPTAVTGAREVQTTGILLFESNTGVGTEASFVGHFRARPGDFFSFLFSHANVGSTMNISTGMIIWASKISDSNLTQVI